MIQVKLYLYNSAQESNEYRGTDLSAYVLSGAQNTENLTEELDVSEIVLQGYPERAEFAPETKFIVEVYQDDIRRYVYHRVVQEDVVEQPILSDEEYFTHTITLIEPSAIAQKRIVDDIAVSYKLKDVTLKQIPAFNQNIRYNGFDKFRGRIFIKRYDVIDNLQCRKQNHPIIQCIHRP